MHNTARSRRALVASAMVLLLSSLARLSPAGNTSATAASREWKAPRSAAATRNPVPRDDKSIATGRTLYAKECASCHGDDGKGNGPEAANLSRQPPDFATPAVSNQSDGELFWKLTEGKKPMPRFARALTDNDRWNIVNYIRSLTR